MDMPLPTLNPVDLDPKEIVFSWEDPDNGKQFTWAMDRVQQAIKDEEVEIISLVLDADYAANADRGLEAHRIGRVMGYDHFDPIVVFHMPDKTALVADGNHRYYVAFLRGEFYIKAYLVPQEIWSKYMVKFPHIDNLTEGFSGIL